MTPGQWTSVLHFTVGGNNGKLGDRIPAFFFCGNGLYPSTALNNVHNYYFDYKNFPLNAWVDIRVMYLKTGSTYRFKVDIDGKEVKNVENKNPQEYKNVKVYASDSWYTPFKGEIRNLKVVLGETSTYIFISFHFIY